MIKWNSRITLIVVLAVAAIYILLNNIWWNYALIEYGKEKRILSLKLETKDSLGAVGDIAHFLIKNSNENVTNNSLNYIYKNKKYVYDSVPIVALMKSAFPNFSYTFKTNLSLHNTVPIRLKNEVVKKIEKIYKNKYNEWIGEGVTSSIIVIILVLIMYNQLEKILSFNRQQNNFLLATAHELKTPVAASKLAIQTLKKSATIDQEPTLNLALRNMDRLSTLMNNVVIANTLESNKVNITAIPIELEPLVNETISELKVSLPSTTIFKTTYAQGLTVLGDPELLKLVFSNLITNAVKYSNLGKEIIEIETYIYKNKVAARVTDYGIGIPLSKQKKIFEKFYRIGDEINRTSKGSGLGLHLVRKILRQHSAIIYVDNNQNPGTCLNIVFKKAKVLG